MTKVAITLISTFVLAGAAIYFIAFNSKTPTPRPIPTQANLPEYERSKIDLKAVGFIFDRQMSKKYLAKLKRKINGTPGVVKVESLANQMTIEITYDPIGISEEELRTRVADSIDSSRIVKSYHVDNSQ